MAEPVPDGLGSAEATADDLSRQFAQPPNTYRMKPLIRVNDEVSQDEMRWQVRSLKEQGCGGLFPLCETFSSGRGKGLELTGSAPHRFLSEWWWQVVEWLAEACAREELEFWVYDEEDWPSGSAGGQLVRQHPEHSWRYLHPAEHTVRGPAAVEIPTGDDLFVAAAGFRKRGDALDRPSLRDLTGQVADGVLRWQAPPGDWTVAVYTAPAGTGLIADTYGDLMSRRAVATLIEWVYQGHVERVARVPKARIHGFFADEPSFSLSMVRAGAFSAFPWYRSMPFTPELPQAFRQRHGDDWRGGVPLLYYDAGAESLRFRMRHWETCCHLYDEHYFKPIYRFCEDRGILSSCHLWVEEQMESHLALQAGNLPTHFRHVHVPGIDWICACDIHRDLPSTTPKYATSMAHLMGRSRSWCESFAACGWGMGFQDMRRIVNFQHVNGINMQIPISYKYSLRHPRRVMFYPPGVSYQQPYWDHFRGFADYEARMCLLASGGGHVAQVALAYPSVDLWANCWDQPGPDGSWDPLRLAERSDEFNRLGDLIRSAGYDYDILDDEAIGQDCRLEGAKLCSRDEQYEALILPRSDAVRRQTAERCLDFVRQGGTAIVCGHLPSHSFEHGSNDPQLAGLLEELLAAGCHRRAAAGERFWQPHGPGRAGFAPTVDEAMEMLREALVPDLRCSPAAGDVFAYHRRLRDADLYLLLNHNEAPRSVEVTLAAQGQPEQWDPQTGTRWAIPDYEITPDGTRLRLAFHGHQIIPLMLYRGAPPSPPLPRRTLVREIPIPGPFDFRAEETLKRPHVAWNLTQQEDGWQGRPAEPFPAQLPSGDWSRLGLPWFSGIGHYEASVDVGELPSPCQVVLDLGKVAVSAEVFVNDTSAGLVFFEPYRLDVTSAMSAGHVRLRIAVANTLSNYFGQFGELEDKDLAHGGDLPQRRVSGLLGPVKLQVWC